MFLFYVKENADHSIFQVLQAHNPRGNIFICSFYTNWSTCNGFFYKSCTFIKLFCSCGLCFLITCGHAAASWNQWFMAAQCDIVWYITLVEQYVPEGILCMRYCVVSNHKFLIEKFFCQYLNMIVPLKSFIHPRNLIKPSYKIIQRKNQITISKFLCQTNLILCIASM